MCWSRALAVDFVTLSIWLVLCLVLVKSVSDWISRVLLVEEINICPLRRCHVASRVLVFKMNGILFCFIMIRKLGILIMARISCSLRPLLLVVVAVLAAHTPPPCLWWCICLWGCMVNRTGSFCGLNITRSLFLPLVTTTKDMKDYVYPHLFPIWFTAVSQKLQWYVNSDWFRFGCFFYLCLCQVVGGFIYSLCFHIVLGDCSHVH